MQFRKAAMFAAALAMTGAIALGAGDIPGVNGPVSTAITAEAAQATSGKCGKNVTWKYDKKTKTLTLSGKGATYNYGGAGNHSQFPSDCKKVVIKKGITKIGNELFSGYDIETVVLPDTVTAIGESAFSVCNLKKCVLPDSIKTIGKSAFFATDIISSSTFKLPKNLQKIGNSAFALQHMRYSSLKKTVKIPGKVKSIGDEAFMGYAKLTIDVPDSVTHLGLDLGVKKIKGHASAYVNRYAEEHGIAYSGKVKKTVIYLKNADYVKEKDSTGKEKLTVTIFDQKIDLKAGVNSGGKLSYRSSNSKVVSVSKKGVLTVKKAGTAKITITSAKTKKYAKASRTITVQVKKADKGMEFTSGDLIYYVLKTGTKTGTAGVGGLVNTKAGSVTIPNTVKAGGVTYTITRLGSGALSSVSLKKVVIKATSLEGVGMWALEINEKGVFIVPKGKLEEYSKMFGADEVKDGDEGEFAKSGFTKGMTIKEQE